MKESTRGSIVTLCVLSLLQDALGKDAYLSLADQHWVSPWFGVPFALTLLLLALCVPGEKA